jgi:hypothetical protein
MAKPGTTCDVFGDNRPYKPGATVTIVVEDETRVLKVCDEHLAFFEDFDPVLWSIGLTFTREVEIRPIGAHPAEIPEEG